jgi:hypothetical protein
MIKQFIRQLIIGCIAFMIGSVVISIVKSLSIDPKTVQSIIMYVQVGTLAVYGLTSYLTIKK